MIIRQANDQPAAAGGQVDSAFPTVALILSMIVEIVEMTFLEVPDFSISVRRNFANASMTASWSSFFRSPNAIAMFLADEDNHLSLSLYSSVLEV